MTTPELPVYASALLDGVEQATARVADAVARGSDGALQVVFDWKCGAQPTSETVDHYRAQVRVYLDMTGAARGLIVPVTTGQSIAPTACCSPRSQPSRRRQEGGRPRNRPANAIGRTGCCSTC